jgi:glycine/D-amino acid oxidase-like deaminating enzyme
VTSDIAIVGAGITGLSVAFHLAERGAGTIVVYEREGVGAGASGVQPGGVRQQWSTRLNCVMARDSLSFYRQLGERLKARVDPGFRPCGYVFVAHAPETLERLSADVALQNDVGVPSRLASAEEAAELVPGLRVEEIAGASYCLEDGYFDRPQSVVEAFAEAAGLMGVAVESANVRGVEPMRLGWRLRFADGTRAEASQVVLAASVDTPALLRPIGVELPIVAEDRWLFFSGPIAERLLDPLVIAVDRRFAAKQLADGRVLASDLGATGDSQGRSEVWRRRVREVATDLFPRLEFVVFPLLVRGVYDVTPDRQAIVGAVSGHDGLYVAAGFSGHGFMMAPAVGRIVAEALVERRFDPALESFAFDRFERGNLLPELQIV